MHLNYINHGAHGGKNIILNFHYLILRVLSVLCGLIFLQE